jgi:protein O-mannosyl-transferase
VVLKAGLILLLTLAAYLPVLQAGYIWDDDDYVTENPALADASGLRHIWLDPSATPQYYPLVFTTFWAEYHLWGLNPTGFHVVNVLLHALAAVLLWRMLLRLRLPGAWLAAALFAAHPVAVESVAWVTERKNVLSIVFYLAAALAYWRWQTPPLATGRRQPAAGSALRWYFIALALFVGALLSKTVACSFPAAMLLVIYWQRGRVTLKEAAPLLPFFALGLGLGWLTAHLEKTHVGAQGADWALTFGQRCLIAGRALWFYAGKLAWPANLTFIYPRWEVSTAVAWQWAFPVTALAVVAGLWAGRKRLGRGPLVAVLFFAGTLFPALGFINLYPMRYSFVADHFQYLACLGLIALAAAGLARLPRPLSAAALCLPFGLAALTWQQAHIYQDQETLWRDTLKKNPGCWMAHNNLGLILADQHKTAEAEAHYSEALRLRPGYPEALNNVGTVLLAENRLAEARDYFDRACKADPNYAESLSNLGVVQFKQGDTNAAVQTLNRALALDPDSVASLVNLSTVLSAGGRAAEAAGYLERVLQRHPGQPTARLNLGLACLVLGRTDDAVVQFKEGLRYSPRDARFYGELAKLAVAQNRPFEAMDDYAQALKLNPDDALVQYNLGVLLGGAGRTDEAIVHYREAVRLRPDYAEGQNNLGVALTIAGKFDEALIHFTEALRLNPAYAEAHNNLAYVLLQSGRRDEAVAHLREALKLDPHYAAAQRQLQQLGLPVPDEK